MIFFTSEQGCHLRLAKIRGLPCEMTLGRFGQFRKGFATSLVDGPMTSQSLSNVVLQRDPFVDQWLRISSTHLKLIATIELFLLHFANAIVSLDVLVRIRRRLMGDAVELTFDFRLK